MCAAMLAPSLHAVLKLACNMQHTGNCSSKTTVVSKRCVITQYVCSLPHNVSTAKVNYSKVGVVVLRILITVHVQRSLDALLPCTTLLLLLLLQ
jgi:hypothetical protein